MSHKLVALWNDVAERMPVDSDWKIVRAINKDEETDFYFMAYYDSDDKYWYFFDEEYIYSMMVTHWQSSPKVSFNIPYKQQKAEGDDL